MYHFKDTIFEGIKPELSASDFSYIANNAGISPYTKNCTKTPAQNAWYCLNDNLGILIFESEDPDKMDRSMQPIYIYTEAVGSRNKLNSYMDHVWDGFYSGQIRESRFPAMVELMPDDSPRWTEI
jgi:hypothetical protein